MLLQCFIQTKQVLTKSPKKIKLCFNYTAYFFFCILKGKLLDNNAIVKWSLNSNQKPIKLKETLISYSPEKFTSYFIIKVILSDLCEYCCMKKYKI